jgi:hemerythrin
MLTHTYPEYTDHKAEHEELSAKLVQFQQEFQAGRTTVSMELLRFLRVWLGEHISVVDSRVGAYLNQQK